MEKLVTLTGTDYEFTVYQLEDRTCAVVGYYHEYEIDSMWAGVTLETFEDVDNSILDVIVNC